MKLHPEDIKQDQETKRLQEESMEELLEEIIGSVKPSPPSAPERNPPSLPGIDKQKKSRFPFFPIGLSIVFLGGVFLGTIFGFLWGKSARYETPLVSFEALESKIEDLMNEIQHSHGGKSGSSVPDEIIEPLETPRRLASESTLDPDCYRNLL